MALADAEAKAAALRGEGDEVAIAAGGRLLEHEPEGHRGRGAGVALRRSRLAADGTGLDQTALEEVPMGLRASRVEDQLRLDDGGHLVPQQSAVLLEGPA